MEDMLLVPAFHKSQRTWKTYNCFLCGSGFYFYRVLKNIFCWFDFYIWAWVFLLWYQWGFKKIRKSTYMNAHLLVVPVWKIPNTLICWGTVSLCFCSKSSGVTALEVQVYILPQSERAVNATIARYFLILC